MKKIFMSVVILLMIIAGCKEDPTPSLYQPDEHAAANKNVPVITSITPDGGSYAGVGEIVINGSNFNPTQPYNDKNQVVFSKPGAFVVGDIIAMTSTQITVASPVLVGDSVSVKVWSSGADPYSDTFVYKLKAAVATISTVDAKQGEANYHCVAVGPDETIYMAVENEVAQQDKGVIKVMNNVGEVITKYPTTFQIAEGIKFGPNNKLYVPFAVGRAKMIKSIDVTTGVESNFATLTTIPRDLDFDPDLNMWVVARQSATALVPSDIIRISPDGSTSTTIATFDAYLKTVRVHVEGGDTYVYVAGENPTTGEVKIWRNKVNAGGTLDAPEVVLDVAAASWLDGSVNSITFSESGMMYISTTAQPDAIFKFDPATQAHEVLFPGLLVPNIKYATWGNNLYMYAVQNIVGGKANLLKVDIGEKGAAYYGRN